MKVKLWQKKSRQQRHLNSNKAIQNLTRQYDKLQQRLDKVYEDKLEGLISKEEWLKKSNEYRSEQERVRSLIEKHENANKDYFNTGLKILELSNRAYELWQARDSYQKRKLLNFVVSNCTLRKEGSDFIVEPTYKKPFDLIANFNNCPNSPGIRSLLRNHSPL